jgi:DNA-binding MarR family transcriptional regulator
MSPSTTVAAPPRRGTAADPETAAGAVIEVVPLLMRWIRTANRASTSDVTVPQTRVLMMLRRTPGVGISAVAENLGVGLASASALVDRLARRGLVDRDRDPVERRRVVLTLTPDGSARLATAMDATRHHLARALADRTAAERAAIVATMAVLSDSISGWDPDPTTDDDVRVTAP